MESIPVQLMYYYQKDDGIRLSWNLSIAELDGTNWYNFMVDANTGVILEKTNWIDECTIEHEHDDEGSTLDDNANLFDIPDYNTNVVSYNEADGIGSYRVFAVPIESPYYGSRSLQVNPANSTASPFGWHDTDGAIGAEFTITRGNNVHAFRQSDSYSPDAGANLIFDYALDFTLDPTTGDNLDSSITNLFYFNNIIHDIMYQYGFNEAAGNFQENNYGNGGVGTDYVKARAHFGVLCNAFFGTPVDGGNGSMEMYLCDNAIPNKDGDFDNLVIAHEYGHGISNRLTGGAGDSDCLGNDEQMGEGWSDFYGLMLTMTSTDTGTTARGIANYLFDYGADGGGIRTRMYTTDMTVNEYTYDRIKATGSSPHRLGEVWATMLWDLTWGLIDQYGFDSDLYNGTGGNNIALTLVTEALKLQPCSPGFVDGRDAILAADVAIYGGANGCLIWSTFARRGLGLSAVQGDTDDRTDGTEAFDIPFPPIALCKADFTIELDANGEASIDTSDIDNGSSVTCEPMSLSISQSDFTCADIGENVVTLTVIDAFGNEATCTSTVTVEDNMAPVISCIADDTKSTDTGLCSYTVQGTEFDATFSDNCPDGSITNNLNNTDSIAGEELEFGETTVIWTVDDGNGQTDKCEVTITVIDDEDPVLMTVQDPMKIWPPNHTYQTFDVNAFFVSVSDNCTPLTVDDVYIASVSSDEEEDAQGGGDGNTTNDIVIAQDCKSVDLRKERRGNGNGRVYTINMMVMDASGNSASASSLVYVPKNNEGTATDDGIAYQEDCTLNRAPIVVENNELPNTYNFDINFWPNPSDSNFNLKVSTDNIVEQINVVVYDVNGRLLHTNTFNPQDTYQFGSEFTTGLYFAKVTQANKTEIIKIIKH
ncbi:MAG: T9SS type A sorting domain-containing protein [Eudoraea sp.]|nr:T9SS type A sorting domain-containing protein [Eudoraea sp.]